MEQNFFFFFKEKLLKKLWHSFSLCIIQSPRRAKSGIYNSTQRFANHKHSSSEGERMNHNKQQSSDGGHDDDAALSDFLASLMDYTPTVTFLLF